MSSAQTASDNQPRKRRPATTPQGRQNQMVNLAMEVAEKQLRDGTATSQVITHFLKLGTTIHEYELAKLKSETELRRAQVENMDSAKRTEQMYAEALKAMKSYAGQEDEYED